MSVTREQARAVALHMVRPYVERGDPYEHLREGGMGQLGRDFSAQIGSYGWGDCQPPRKLGIDALTVFEVGRVPCCFIFSLRELYDELKTGTKQLSMFEAVEP